jgi:hypothetical protein
MGPAEVAWRGTRAGRGVVRTISRTGRPSEASILGTGSPDWPALLAAFRSARGRPVLLDRARARSIALHDPQAAQSVVDAADRVMDHRFTFFAYPEAAFGPEIDWHHDPGSGARWPLIPASRIDHRSASGDPKWIWELNRLQHLPWLAQAWLFTDEARYADEALSQIDSWTSQNPPGVGIAWRGAFEAGVRAISIAVALQGLRDAPGLTPERYRSTVLLLAESGRRCWDDRSRFSSSNNHLVGELAGLATIAILFPELAQASAWELRALRQLGIEAARQILPDGAGAEQALGYQVFTAELMLVVAALLRARGDEAPASIMSGLDRSATYLAGLVGDGDPVPRYGDDDEGFALRLGQEATREVHDHLGLVAAFTGNVAARRSGRLDISAMWLAGAEGQHRWAATSPGGAPQSLHAQNGGLVVLRSRGRRLTMDIAPLGYLSIAAHGHADALSLTLSIDGKELIGDPGPGSYYGHPDWRRAHQGTRMHATLSVDDLDQSELGGAFLWTHHASVTTRHVDLDAGVVEAEHDGFRRLDDPVSHRRWLVAPPDEETIVVVDLVECAGAHTVRTAWPLHPSVHAQECPAGHRLLVDGVPKLDITQASSADPLETYAILGDEQTHLGWWSERLESRRPAWLVGGLGSTIGPVAVATIITPTTVPEVRFGEVSVALDEQAVQVTWTDRRGVRSLRFDRTRHGVIGASEDGQRDS